MMNDYSLFEYAISAGNGTLIAYGIANRQKIVNLTNDILNAYGEVFTLTEVAASDAETGQYSIIETFQLYG